MHFSLSETQEHVKDLASQIIGDTTSPAQLSKLDSNGYFDRDLWQTLAEAGLLGVAIDADYGGMGMDFETLCVLLEVAGAHACPTPLLSVLVNAVLPLQRFADKTVCAEILPNIASGDCLVTGALNIQDTQLVISSEGEQAFVDGDSSLVSLGFDADYALLYARLNGQVAVVLVDLNQTSCTRDKQVMTNGEFAATLSFSKTPCRIIAQEINATYMGLFAQQYELAAEAAYGCGTGQAMINKACSHTSERKQFGKALGSFQAVQHQLADAHIHIECLRAARENAIYQLAQNERSPQTAQAVLIAKIWLGDALHKISHVCQQVHGGTGIDHDYGMFRFCTAARMLELNGGNSTTAQVTLGASLAAQ